MGRDSGSDECMANRMKQKHPSLLYPVGTLVSLTPGTLLHSVTERSVSMGAAHVSQAGDAYIIAGYNEAVTQSQFRIKHGRYAINLLGSAGLVETNVFVDAFMMIAYFTTIQHVQEM